MIGPSNIDLHNIMNSLHIGDSCISISQEVEYLGAVIDCHLNLNKHIANVCTTCFIKIRQIWRIRRNLSLDSAKSLVHANIISRLDHINMIFIGLPRRETQKLQRVMNAAARLVFAAPQRARSDPLLMELHWLPIRARIEFKVMTMVFKCLVGDGPPYLNCLLSKYMPERENMRSENTLLLRVPDNEDRYTRRTFAWYAPKRWNKLPVTIRTLPTLSRFKKALKTHYFQKYFILGIDDF